jgi:hypothetical protein
MFKPLLASLGMFTAFAAHADTQPTPQPLTRSAQEPAKNTVLRRMPAPTMSVMRVTRQADGTLATDCVQQPNPRARNKSNGAQP